MVLAQKLKEFVKQIRFFKSIVSFTLYVKISVNNNSMYNKIKFVHRILMVVRFRIKLGVKNAYQITYKLHPMERFYAHKNKSIIRKCTIY